MGTCKHMCDHVVGKMCSGRENKGLLVKKEAIGNNDVIKLNNQSKMAESTRENKNNNITV